MFYVLHDNKYIVLKNGQTSDIEIFFGIKLIEYFMNKKIIK